MSNNFSNFTAGNYVQPTRKTLNVKNFVGVDLLNAQTNVSSQRGVFSNNYVWIDNKAQKRWAYDKIAYVPKTAYYPVDYDADELVDKNSDTATTNGNNFNGMWTFTADDGVKHTIAHIGHLLYEVDGIDGDRPSFSPIFVTRDSKSNCSYEIEDYRSFAVAGQKRLWLLAGEEYLMVYYALNSAGKYVPQIEKVAMSDYAFVPTTTMSITCTNAKNAGREGLDYPNLLSPYRQNLLLSGTGKEETEDNATQFYEYTLDGGISFESGKEAQRMFAMEIEITYSGTVED